MKILHFLFLPAMAMLMSVVVAGDPDAGASEWSIREHLLPSSELVGGFEAPGHGLLQAPPLPEAGATDEEIVNFLRQSHLACSSYLAMSGIDVPEGALFAFDPERLALCALMSEEAHDRLARLLRVYHAALPIAIPVDVVCVRAPSAMVRDWVDNTGGQGDHGFILGEIERAADLNSEIEMRRATLECVSGLPSSLALTSSAEKPADSPGEPPKGENARGEPAGPSLFSIHIDPTLDFMRDRVSLNMELEIRPVACDDDALHGGNRENLHSRLAQSLTLRRGDWRLVGAWNDPLASPGIHTEGRMAAVFIRVDFHPLAHSGSQILRQMLEDHGDALVGDIKGPPDEEESADPPHDRLVLRIIPAVYDFPFSDGTYRTQHTDEAGGPGSGREIGPKMTQQEMLQQLGIRFPEGASASKLHRRLGIVVRNTPEEIAKIEKLAEDSMRDDSPRIIHHLYLVEAPPSVFGKIGRNGDPPDQADPGLEGIIADGEANVLATWLLETSAGTLGLIEIGSPQANATNSITIESKRENLPLKEPENIWMDPFASDIPAPDSAPRPKVFFETRLHVDLGFPQGTPDADSARAQARRCDRHRLRLSTNFFLQPGETRLVGNWSPPPPEDDTAPDSMHALFVRLDMWEPAR